MLYFLTNTVYGNFFNPYVIKQMSLDLYGKKWHYDRILSFFEAEIHGFEAILVTSILKFHKSSPDRTEFYRISSIVQILSRSGFKNYRIYQ